MAKQNIARSRTRKPPLDGEPRNEGNIDDGQAYSEAIIDALVFIDDAAEMLENMADCMPELAAREAQENGNVLPAAGGAS